MRPREAAGDIPLPDLQALLQRLAAERFTGQVVMKWENGTVTLVRQEQRMDRHALKDWLT